MTNPSKQLPAAHRRSQRLRRGVNRAAARETSEQPRTPSTRREPPMGLADVLLYAFCAFIVGVFIFNLVDTAQTAKRKIAAKKHD